ncbi:hypothetical protein K435DRAFT_878983 [Dendrothele bispora CBS 962.96]|uniref:Uncharacterized protein n=1 Tax=Dendrothele bispora (strain CBS 962.96) TaxID=1314807 RepID=A0A4S8KM22_DENBC|nr:hypothetical protein K435DRAFT_878983 [Dendrothele bispora CBS 962.96]
MPLTSHISETKPSSLQLADDSLRTEAPDLEGLIRLILIRQQEILSAVAGLQLDVARLQQQGEMMKKILLTSSNGDLVLYAPLRVLYLEIPANKKFPNIRLDAVAATKYNPYDTNTPTRAKPLDTEHLDADHPDTEPMDQPSTGMDHVEIPTQKPGGHWLALAYAHPNNKDSESNNDSES